MSDEKPEQPVTPAKTATPARRGGFLLPLLVLLLLGGVGAGGFYGYQTLRALQSENQRQDDAVRQLQQRLREQQETREQALASQREQLDRMESQLAAYKDSIRQMRAGGQLDWLLNEAEALASLAQQRLLLTGDVAAARRLLEAADEVLVRVEEPGVISARKALAADLEALRGAARVDIAGLVLRLDAMGEQVAGLTLPAGDSAEPRAPAERQADSGWARLLQRLPVNVRRHDEALPLPLDRQQASLLRLYLFSDLQKAQLAALQARPPVYVAALDSARRTLDAWFAGDEAVTRLDGELEELRGASLEKALPAIGDGLAAIRALIAEQGGAQ